MHSHTHAHMHALPSPSGFLLPPCAAPAPAFLLVRGRNQQQTEAAKSSIQSERFGAPVKTLENSLKATEGPRAGKTALRGACGSSIHTISRRDREAAGSRAGAALCMKRPRLVPCPPLGKVTAKNPPGNWGCCPSVLREPRGPSEERRGAAGWSAVTCYWGVRQQCVSGELEPYYPLIWRSGGLEGKMWRPEGSELDQAKLPREGGWGQRDDGDGRGEWSEEAPRSCTRPGYISMSRAALCGQSVGSHFCQWSQWLGRAAGSSAALSSHSALRKLVLTGKPRC